MVVVISWFGLVLGGKALATYARLKAPSTRTSIGMILKDEFKATLEFYDLEMKDIIFMQDNASCHTAGIIQEWFQDNGLEDFQ
jgi:hypothetical protein